MTSKRQLAVETFEALESHDQQRLREQWPCFSCRGEGKVLAPDQEARTCIQCCGRGVDTSKLEELG